MQVSFKDLDEVLLDYIAQVDRAKNNIFIIGIDHNITNRVLKAIARYISDKYPSRYINDKHPFGTKAIFKSPKARHKPIPFEHAPYRFGTDEFEPTPDARAVFDAKFEPSSYASEVFNTEFQPTPDACAVFKPTPDARAAFNLQVKSSSDMQFYAPPGTFESELDFGMVEIRETSILLEVVLYRSYPYQLNELSSLKLYSSTSSECSYDCLDLEYGRPSSSSISSCDYLKSLVNNKVKINGLELPCPGMIDHIDILKAHQTSMGYNSYMWFQYLAKNDTVDGHFSEAFTNMKNEKKELIYQAAFGSMRGKAVFGRNQDWLFSLFGTVRKTNVCFAICGLNHLMGNTPKKGKINKRYDTKFGLRKMIQQDKQKRFVGLRFADIRLDIAPVKGYFNIEMNDHGIVR